MKWFAMWPGVTPHMILIFLLVSFFLSFMFLSVVIPLFSCGVGVTTAQIILDRKPTF